MVRVVERVCGSCCALQKCYGQKSGCNPGTLSRGQLTFALRLFHRKGQVWGSCPRLDRQAGGGAAA